jgi:hypothetical protein
LEVGKKLVGKYSRNLGPFWYGVTAVRGRYTWKLGKQNGPWLEGSRKTWWGAQESVARVGEVVRMFAGSGAILPIYRKDTNS